MSMMPFRPSRRALLAAAPLLALPLGGGRAIGAESDFSSFLAGLRRDALAQGVRPGTVDLAFRYIQFLPRVIELDQHQPDHTLTFADFITKVVNPQRIEDARRNLAENLGLLQRVQQRFGVQPRFIVALWGAESDFGKTQGSYSVPAVPSNFDTRLAGLESRRPLGDWIRMGVRSVGAPLTGREAADASLLLPDGPGGRALLVFDNFRATMKWNKSVKFAASVGMIADGVERG